MPTDLLSGALLVVAVLAGVVGFLWRALDKRYRDEISALREETKVLREEQREMLSLIGKQTAMLQDRESR